MKSFFKNLTIAQVPLFLFVCSVVKYLIVAPTHFDIALTGILGVVAFLYQYFGQNKEIEALKNDMIEKFNKFEIGVENLAKEKIKIQSEINGLKLRVGGTISPVKSNVNAKRRF